MGIDEYMVEMTTTAHKSSEATEEYFDIFEARRKTMNAHDGRAGYHEGMLKKSMIKIMDERKNTTDEVDRDPTLKKKIEESAMTTSSEEFLACLFILLADNGRYKGLKIELANDFTMGQSNYPKMVGASKSLLTDYIAPGKINYFKQEPDNAGIAFS